MNENMEVVIYQSEDGSTQLDVTLENETVWLNQQQITELFDRDRTVITRHINNIFKEGELTENSNVQKMHIANSDKPIQIYSLDVIISVGYRVNSKRGTQFRIWANKILKDHIVRGFSINEKRLKQQQQKLSELEAAVTLIVKSAQTEGIKLNETKGLLDILSQYTQSFITLSRFDSESLSSGNLSTEITFEISYAEARTAIEELKKELMKKNDASDIFGNEKDDSFKGILGSIVQTFDGQYLYASIEEQAAHLLYFLIKNHPFSDGNKRIGAFLFIWFLERNKHRLKKSGEAKINDNALVALALLVAQSDPATKDLMILLIINLINKQ